MSTTFMIFTMQTGYGLVESGMCHRKNEVSILLTNAIDVGLGGFFYWMFGCGGCADVEMEGCSLLLQRRLDSEEKNSSSSIG